MLAAKTSITHEPMFERADGDVMLEPGSLMKRQPPLPSLLTTLEIHVAPIDARCARSLMVLVEPMVTIAKVVLVQL